MGVGEAKQNAKMLEAAQEQLATIAGQQPSVRRARKSIASFKVREGMPVGLSVTLRRARMWEFLDRLTSIAVPRIRDFRGLNPRSFDGRGNYSMGVKRAADLPRNRLRLDRRGARPRRDDRDLGARPTRRRSSCCSGWACRSPKRAGPGSRDAEAEAEAEEERRKEEARLRAEAEQAALEQLKEENPEAYAKPEPDGSARGGRGRRRRARDASSTPPPERPRTGEEESRGWLRLR